MALTMKGALAACLAGCLFLAACGSDKSEKPLQLEVLEMTLPMITGGGGPVPKVQMTRDQLEAPGLPVAKVAIPARDLESYLLMRDSRGAVRTFGTNGGQLVTLRDGLLIATRGMMPDLMSADVPAVSQLSRDGGSHGRSYFYLGDNDSMDRVDYACTAQRVGPEAITLAGRVHRTVHMRESCAGPAGNIVNDYWIEGGSHVRKAREWFNPSDGYIETEGLVD